MIVLADIRSFLLAETKQKNFKHRFSLAETRQKFQPQIFIGWNNAKISATDFHWLKQGKHFSHRFSLAETKQKFQPQIFIGWNKAKISATDFYWLKESKDFSHRFSLAETKQKNFKHRFSMAEIKKKFQPKIFIVWNKWKISATDLYRSQEQLLLQKFFYNFRPWTAHNRWISPIFSISSKTGPSITVEMANFFSI
jgi:hypothetical protein